MMTPAVVGLLSGILPVTIPTAASTLYLIEFDVAVI